MKKLIGTILTCALVVAPISIFADTYSFNSSTATEKTTIVSSGDVADVKGISFKASKKAYKYKTVDKSETFKGDYCTISVDNHYKRVVLKGKTKAIKKINKKIKSLSTAFFENEYSAKGIASESVNEITSGPESEAYYDYVEQNVTYIDDNIISISSGWFWYAGGVSNSNISGLTFDLKTGKQIKNIKRVTKLKTLKGIKKRLTKLINQDDAGYDASEIQDKKANEFNFYIKKNGNIVVCFGPYELGYGGWSKLYTLKGNIK